MKSGKAAASPPVNSKEPGKKAQKKAKTPRIIAPWLDDLLTFLFFGELAYMGTSFYASGELGTFLVYIALSGLAIVITREVFGFFAVRFSRLFLTQHGDPMKNPLILKKAKDQAWQLVIHASMTIFEIWLLSLDNWKWWEETEHAWIPYPARWVNPSGQPNHWGVRVYYLTQLAIWTATCLTHKFVDAKKKDYVVMYVHHLATILLVFGSHAVEQWRIGIIVLYCHDTSDIVIDLLKLSGHFNLGGAKGLFTSEILFISTLISWVYYRLYRFPVYVIYSSCIYSRVYSFDPPDHSSFWEHLHKDFWAYGNGIWWQSNILLILLLCLHFWWFYLLLRIAYKLTTGASTKDAEQEEYEIEKAE